MQNVKNLIDYYGAIYVRIMQANFQVSSFTGAEGERVDSSDGSRSKIFDPGRVRHLWFGFEF